MKKSKIEEKYLIEKIKTGTTDNLSLSCDCDDDYEVVADRFPVMLYTPDMSNTSEHFHISFSDVEAYKLSRWLDKYFKMKGVIGE